MTTKNKNKTITIVIIVCFFVVIGILFVQNRLSETSSLSPFNNSLSAKATIDGPHRDVPSDSKEYYNNAYHFSLLYPDNLSVKEFPEQGGGLTVTFEYLDKTIANGFQIFIVPFTDTKISEERFKEDVPLGVRENLKDITIDGATGASFYSINKILGDTAEVWFIKNGYLYEVTSFKEDAEWLSDILSTWKFF